MSSIPQIDLASLDPGALDHALSDVGFVEVVGHGIDSAVLRDMRQSVIDYFALPEATKLGGQIQRDNYRGYIPLGFFNANEGGGAADRYEGYKLHTEVSANHPIRDECDLYGPNRWPEELPALKMHVTAYWRECDRVMRQLLTAVAEILGVPRNDFLALFETPLTNMTLLHYPSQPAHASGVGIHPHKDTDVLTLLVNDPAGGLFVKPRDGDDWIEVEGPADALTVNVGDMLEIFSGGLFVSTPHKVVNQSGRERFSYPYFVVPRHDVVVEPLVKPVAGFDRAPVYVGDVSREVWRTNWPDTVSERPEFDLGTLANA